MLLRKDVTLFEDYGIGMNDFLQEVARALLRGGERERAEVGIRNYSPMSRGKSVDGFFVFRCKGF